MADHHAALTRVLAGCTSQTRIDAVYIVDGKLCADIVTDLRDPSSLSGRFYKAGYRVDKVECRGGDIFTFTLTRTAK